MQLSWEKREETIGGSIIQPRTLGLKVKFQNQKHLCQLNMLKQLNTSWIATPNTSKSIPSLALNKAKKELNHTYMS
jgi:hypothetical protein